MDGVCELDALIVGAGFGGISMLCRLRNLGLSVKIYEWGSDLGGTWFWNRYPGARVDSAIPLYQYFGSEEKSPKVFPWSQRFPGREELQRYFHYLDEVLDLSRDISYDTYVEEAEFDDVKYCWHVKTNTETITTARHLILCTGFASKRYTPAFKGLETFKGVWHHSARWPEDGLDITGKRVAVIGTGASGVQIIQELGPQVGHLTVYQRTPNLAIPMQQRYARDSNYQDTENDEWKWPDNENFQTLVDKACQTFSGFVEDFTLLNFDETSASDREKLYEKLWAYGGLGYWLSSFKELFTRQEANDEIYAFWAKKVRVRVHNSAKKELLAPLIPPHTFGTKRPCLESTYYEVFNQDNVDIIDLNSFPILEITAEGVKTERGVVPVDVLILATGFDAATGGILDIMIRNEHSGLSIQEKWKKGTKTCFGICTHGLPNLYWLYGPHAPTDLSNGPTCVWIQSNWIAELMSKMSKNGERRVEVDECAELDWTNEVHVKWHSTLFPGTPSSYHGTTIPGKMKEPLYYVGGVGDYFARLQECRRKNYPGFSFR